MKRAAETAYINYVWSPLYMPREDRPVHLPDHSSFSFTKYIVNQEINI